VLRQRAPEALRAKLGRSLPLAPGGVPRSLLVAVAISVATLGAVVALFVAQSDRLVDVAVRRIPPAWETQLGELTVAPYIRGGRVIETGEAARAVQEIGARLVSQVQSPYTFRWYLVDDPQVNALAAPGGAVVVFMGLLRATDSPEELAGVLAHEIQHVLLRHSLRAMVRGLGWRATLSLLFSGAGELGGATAGMVEQLGGLRYSRSQETAADVAGVRLLQSAQIDPHGMATFFEKLANRGGDLPALLSTHPDSALRARQVRDLLQGVPAVAPLPYAWNWK
jgi:predicted Zn-dependent protease